MSTRKLILLLAAFLLSFAQPANSFGFIQGYDIDSSGKYGDDCEIISSSVTGKSSDLLIEDDFNTYFSIVINCPKTDSYEVFLTAVLANTTISDIQNEVKGVSDELGLDIEGDELDFTRRINVEDVKVSLVTKSYEF